MKPNSAFFYAFLCLNLSNLAFINCLYSDEAGKFDWRHQYTGKPKLMLFDTDGQSGKRVITATEQNVLASLNARNGQIAWRQVFEKTEVGRIDDIKLAGNNVMSVHGGGSYVRAFSTSTGDLVWETNVEAASTDNRASVFMSGSKVVVLAGSKLMKIAKYSGDTEWTTTLPNSDTTNYHYAKLIGSDILTIGIVSESHITVVSISEDEGAQKSPVSVPAGWITVDTRCSVVGGNQFVCLDTRSGIIQVLDLEKSQMFNAVLPQNFGITVNKMIFLQANDHPSNEFIVRFSCSHVVVFKAQAGSVTVVKDMRGTAAATIVPHGETQAVMAVKKVAQNTLEITGYEISTGEVIQDLSVTTTFQDHHGNPSELYGVHFKKRDGTSAIKLMIVSEDHSIVMLQQSGKLSWTREESLASIVSAEMVDLPVSPILAKMDEEFGSQTNDIFSMFVRRFTTQFLQLKEFLISLKSKLLLPKHHHHSNEEADAVVAKVDDEEDEYDYLTRDEFNIHKMMVLVTSAGKIFGLNSEKGMPEWKHFIPDIKPFDKYGKQSLPLFVQRTTAHFPHAPRAVVIGQHKVTGQGHLFTFNPITGEPVDGMPAGGETLNFYIRQVTMLSQMNDVFVRPLVIMDTGLKYHSYPEKSSRLVSQLSPSLYMFSADIDSSTLVGYNVRQDGDELVAQELWVVDLGKESETITNVAAKRPNEHVHSQGVVLGDRNVLYKYINPNLVVVTTEEKDVPGKGGLNVYLVDTITGHIVFQCSHKRTKGPVTVVHSENWVVYSYWSTKHRRNEVTVLELYEGQKQSNATSFSSLSPPPPPIVMRQSYVINAHITAMESTITEKGITNKNVMIALETGGILGMPRILLDARRPLNPTADTREEGLMPYIPELPKAAEMTVNYHQSVMRIHGIHAAPAGLESTSLVICYGLDIFFTRVTPSKMFDVLKEDFDYFFISCVLVGMISVSVISRKLAQRKILKKAWK